MNHAPTFTYQAPGDQRSNADAAAIRYCTAIGKTYEFKGMSDGDLLSCICK